MASSAVVIQRCRERGAFQSTRQHGFQLGGSVRKPNQLRYNDTRISTMNDYFRLSLIMTCDNQCCATCEVKSARMSRQEYSLQKVRSNEH